MNRVKQSEREALVLYAKQRINLDARGNSVDDTDDLQADIMQRFGVSKERAGRAIGLAILRARGEMVRDRARREGRRSC